MKVVIIAACLMMGPALGLKVINDEAPSGPHAAAAAAKKNAAAAAAAAKQHAEKLEQPKFIYRENNPFNKRIQDVFQKANTCLDEMFGPVNKGLIACDASPSVPTVVKEMCICWLANKNFVHKGENGETEIQYIQSQHINHTYCNELVAEKNNKILQAIPHVDSATCETGSEGCKHSYRQGADIHAYTSVHQYMQAPAAGSVQRRSTQLQEMQLTIVKSWWELSTVREWFNVNSQDKSQPTPEWCSSCMGGATFPMNAQPGCAMSSAQECTCHEHDMNGDSESCRQSSGCTSFCGKCYATESLFNMGHYEVCSQGKADLDSDACLYMTGMFSKKFVAFFKPVLAFTLQGLGYAFPALVQGSKDAAAVKRIKLNICQLTGPGAAKDCI